MPVGYYSYPAILCDLCDSGVACRGGLRRVSGGMILAVVAPSLRVVPYGLSRNSAFQHWRGRRTRRLAICHLLSMVPACKSEWWERVEQETQRSTSTGLCIGNSSATAYLPYLRSGTTNVISRGRHFSP